MGCELKPCPFCGGEASVSTGYQNTTPPTALRYVECIECAAASDMLDTEEEAIAMWNRRHEPLTKIEPLSIGQLRGMDGELVWCGNKCFIVNIKYKSHQGWSDECGIDLWGQGTSLNLLARCGCYIHKPEQEGGI